MNHRSVNEEGEERPKAQEQRVPCSVWRSLVEQVSMLQSMEDPVPRVSACALKKAAACEKPLLEQVPGRTCDPVGDPSVNS